jgi:hypothetical protein
VHGEKGVQLIFKTKLEAKGYNHVEIPALGDAFTF